MAADDGELAAAAIVDGTTPGAGDMCAPVIVRFGIIDYLREWRLTERVEHLKKTLVRDILAGERNHAVVPVDKFAEKFGAFLGKGLFAPSERAWAPPRWEQLLAAPARLLLGPVEALLRESSAGGGVPYHARRPKAQ
eukprot:1252626-Prymnesium_polylepis.1